jgi:hypothetical protein
MTKYESCIPFSLFSSLWLILEAIYLYTHHGSNLHILNCSIVAKMACFIQQPGCQWADVLKDRGGTEGACSYLLGTGLEWKGPFLLIIALLLVGSFLPNAATAGVSVHNSVQLVIHQYRLLSRHT